MSTKYKLFNGERIALSDDESNQMNADVKKTNAERDARAWLDGRLADYPPIAEQLDMQYWDSINGTSLWADLITEIKAKYPK